MHIRLSMTKAEQLKLFGEQALRPERIQVRPHQRVHEGRPTQVRAHARMVETVAAPAPTIAPAAVSVVDSPRVQQIRRSVYRNETGWTVLYGRMRVFVSGQRAAAEWMLRHLKAGGSADSAAFAAAAASDVAGTTAPPQPPSAPAVDSSALEKAKAAFRKTIESHQARMNELRQPRLVNTNKRMREAASAEHKAQAHEREVRLAQTMLARLDRGEMPRPDDVRFLNPKLRSELESFLPNELRAAPWESGNQGHTIEQEAALRAPHRLRWNNPDERYWMYTSAEKVRGGPALMAREPSGFGPDYTAWLSEVADLIEKDPREAYFAERTREMARDSKRLNAVGINDLPSLVSSLHRYVEWKRDVGYGYLPKRAPTIDRTHARDSFDERMERALAEEKVRSEPPSQIASYFPTPPPVVEEMIELAAPAPGETVLEPSAGSGHILDRLPGDITMQAIEIAPSLRDVLTKKGYDLVGSNFLEYAPAHDDAPHVILMNPPFEDGQDMEHVRHAYEVLRPGGRLAAVMSAGAFFRSDRKATGFREWLAPLDHHERDLPAGTFKRSGTGVAAHLVFIRKPE